MLCHYNFKKHSFKFNSIQFIFIYINHIHILEQINGEKWQRKNQLGPQNQQGVPVAPVGRNLEQIQTQEGWGWGQMK